MINIRLMWYLENHNFLPSTQSGFRANRSTFDQLIGLEDSIHTAVLNKEYNISVFLDFEKAYDMLWKGGLLYKFKKLNIQGNMFGWIKDFLSSRTFQVRIDSQPSNIFSFSNGTPQGSVISPTLFNIMVSDLPQAISKCSISQFADDTSIKKSSRNLQFATKCIEQDLIQIQDWCDKWGFKLSSTKTKMIIFTHKVIPSNFSITFMGNQLVADDYVKILGLFFDKRLTWKIHINHLVDKSQKIINLLRYLSGTNWGCNGSMLLRLYQSLLRSRIDYGCLAYNSASDTQKKRLDVIANKALRICVGALPQSAISTLQLETGELPLQQRRNWLMMKYYHKLKQYSVSHPLYLSLQGNWFYSGNLGKYIPFFAAIKILLTDLGLPNFDIMPLFPSPYPIWMYCSPSFNLGLISLISKTRDNILTMKSKTSEYISSNWSYHLQIYTDGSKQNNICSVAFCILFLEYFKGVTLPDFCSIFLHVN